MKKSCSIIINYKSGTQSRKKQINSFLNRLDHRLFDINVQETKRPQHANLIAKEALTNGVDLVIAIGGDGTLNEVASALVSSPVVLGVFPSGSGNGLARSLKIPFDPIAAADLINSFQNVKTDCASLNGKYFFNVAGVGFDAQVSYEFVGHKKRGFYAYIPLVFKNLSSPLAYDFKLETATASTNFKAHWASFFLGTTYGGFINPNPDADVADGLLEVVFVNLELWRYYPLIFWQGLFGFKDLSPVIKKFQVSAAKLTATKQQKVLAHLDGEPVETKNTLQIKVHRQAIRIIRP